MRQTEMKRRFENIEKRLNILESNQKKKEMIISPVPNINTKLGKKLSKKTDKEKPDRSDWDNPRISRVSDVLKASKKNIPFKSSNKNKVNIPITYPAFEDE